MKNLQCPHEDISCSELDSSGMDKPECKNCEHYGDGVRLTGAIGNPQLKRIWEDHSTLILWCISLFLLIVAWIILSKG